ncbi:MAG: hypothetical protein A3F14_04075 [Gammaproteobacteria bacterium RIFCSPHIGHO2_12_FULL_43_28]|nr:MAG: hypothetical protein A3F14_04075 [Gammaproteobacteria bacterium RIFCSPHIGHO2_12_FULL_43_28]
MIHRIVKHGFIPACLLTALPVYAATPINLSHQPVSFLLKLSSQEVSSQQIKFDEISRSIDFNKTTHVRIQQRYAGYKVWGADAVVHIPQGGHSFKTMNDVLNAAKSNNGFMNGTVYQNLKADLDQAPKTIFTKAAAKKATETGIESFQHEIGGKVAPQEISNELVVYIDKNNKAHWAFKVNFYVDPIKEGTAPSKPVYILDATTLKVYEYWDDIQTLQDGDDEEKVEVSAGGFGGNIKMGKLAYDGLESDLAKLTMLREKTTNQCYLQNDEVFVKKYSTQKAMSFDCEKPDEEHGNIYWDADFDAVNDGYSPGNDALFGGAVIKAMYKKWYDKEVLVNADGTPMLLTMVVHLPSYDNAYWDGRKMSFGDGRVLFYPLTSLGVAAHEISHGFTQQHSNLIYRGHSGGMNEAYSDMAAQAAEVFAYGKNSWLLGAEIFKQEGRAIRYYDQPSKDCRAGREPGQSCSIDEVSQYHEGLDVHYSSGIYNRAFYLMGTADGWTTRKAFDVMVKANTDYWTSGSTFEQGACGVIQAAKDYGYDTETVLSAFTTVGVDTSECTVPDPSVRS